MHDAALILLILAGASFCLGGILRWRSLSGAGGRREVGFLWLGMALLSVVVVVALLDGQHLRFLYAVLAVWAAVAATFFVTAFLAMPGPGLLVLPAGGLALLVAVIAGLEQPNADFADGVSWFTLVHVLFMASYSGVILIGGAAAGLYLMAARELKAASRRSLLLPRLPVLARIAYVALVVGCALLIGGVATGGAAMRLREGFSALSPVPILAVVNLIALSLALGAHALHGFGQRALARITIAMTLLMLSVLIALFLDAAHG